MPLSLFIFLLFPLISFRAEGVSSERCQTAIRKSVSKGQQNPGSTNVISNHPEQIDFLDQAIFLAPPQPSAEEKTNVQNKTRKTKAEKIQAEKDFLLAFQRRNKANMNELIRQFPFLKKIRFTDSFLLEEIPIIDRQWCPRGWSPLQIASYKKDLDLLEFLLSLDMEFRAKKKPGGESLESNPLHIAIRRDFREGAKKILSHAKLIRFGHRNRFVDEKDHLKKTPWYLAVQKDIQNRILRYTNIVGRYKPSGHASSYTPKGPKDGYQIAMATREPDIIRQAHRYLVAPNYEKYKLLREESSRPNLTPP